MSHELMTGVKTMQFLTAILADTTAYQRLTKCNPANFGNSMTNDSYISGMRFGIRNGRRGQPRLSFLCPISWIEA
jgi:hypothetical protein